LVPNHASDELVAVETPYFFSSREELRTVLKLIANWQLY
jgi:hypothetical protein